VPPCRGPCTVRYEDALTNPEHPFACGITLDRISGYTVDEEGREAFITNNPLKMLRKASVFGLSEQA
jgi:vacuolar protein sorting-associated protein 13A/C